MKTFEEMEFHPTTEKLVGILQDRTQRDDSLFFRIMVSYYFALAASQMRCNISYHGAEIPVNMYALNLAPSGYGKTMSSNLMEEEVLLLFRTRFLEETFPAMADDNLAKLAIKRANRKGTDPDDELSRVTKEFDATGEMVFSFDSGSSPAVKQLRHKLLMANAGSMNLIMDEVASNLSANQEAFATFIELYDKGLTKQKITKVGSDNKRSEEIIGKTPANLLMFGVPVRLLDGAKTEEDLMNMLEQGYARRCFFGYVRSAAKKKVRTPEQMYDDQASSTNDAIVGEMANRLENLADMINADKKLQITKATCILLNEYQLNCEARAEHFSDNQEIMRSEVQNRSFKVLKLAGAYAFIDDSASITDAHVYNAIKLAEESGDAFAQLLARDKPWVKLAKYFASAKHDVTQADMAADLPFYKGGVGAKAEMLSLAISYGYKNNIIIKKSFCDGIEFLRGETLKNTELTRMRIAYSTEITTDYMNEEVPFNDLHKLTQAPGMHWVNHHLNGGYRNNENCHPGFNLLVLDVDGGTTLANAKSLLTGFKALYYTTKRHTEDANRFRILLPMNYELQMDDKDYTEFYKNVEAWLPFTVDPQCSSRSKKWMTNPGHFEYAEGEMFDVLPFIPKTSKNEARKVLLDSQSSMDNLERWVIGNTGDGNRNNMLLRYAMMLLDGGFNFDNILTRVTALNEKLPDKLSEIEVMTTIMKTVNRRMPDHI